MVCFYRNAALSIYALYLVLDLLKEKKSVLLLLYIISVIGGVIMRCGLFKNGFDWYILYTNCFANLDLILVGMLTAEIKCCYDITIAGKEKIFKTIAASCFALLVIYNCYIYSSDSSEQFIYKCILPSAYAVSCGILILLSGNRTKKSEKNLFQTCINWFAKYSYTFYIFHIAVFGYLTQTLVLQDWFVQASSITQYIVFFTVSFCLIICMAVPFNWVGQVFVEKFRTLEKRKVGK